MTLIWLAALVLGVIVILVVAALLSAILRTAKAIEATAGAIWSGGGRIAANTVHVPDLARSNRLVEEILGQAPTLLGELQRIEAHAKECPGCPQCVAGGVL